MNRPRNPDGTFKSAFDVALEADEAEWNGKIRARMDAGMTFDEAWVAEGGQIIPIESICAPTVRLAKYPVIKR